MRRTIRTALAALWLPVAVAAQAASPVLAPRVVPVVWLIGQSNAEGATAGYWLSNPLSPGNSFTHLASQRDVRIWWPGPSLGRPQSVPSWESYRVGSYLPLDNGSFYIVEGTFGPEASLGDATRARFGEAFVFKFTWIASLDPRAGTSWQKRPGRWGLYDALMLEWHRAAAALHASGVAPELRGIVWVHGEADCFSPGESDPLEYSRSYAANLQRFIADLRGDLARQGRAPIPFAIAQLHDRHLPRQLWRDGEALVRSGQAEVARLDPAVGLTNTDGFGVYPYGSQIHFDAVGSLQLGYALYATLASLFP